MSLMMYNEYRLCMRYIFNQCICFICNHHPLRNRHIDSLKYRILIPHNGCHFHIQRNLSLLLSLRFYKLYFEYSGLN